MLLFRKYMAWYAALQGINKYTQDNVKYYYDAGWSKRTIPGI